MSEKVIGIINGFFEANEFFKTFYEIVFTDEKILIVKSGETFRAYFASADVAHPKREMLKELDVNQIVKSFDEVETISYDEVEKIEMCKKTFIKNAILTIQLKRGKKTFYSNIKGSLDEYKEIFKSISPPLIYSIS